MTLSPSTKHRAGLAAAAALAATTTVVFAVPSGAAPQRPAPGGSPWSAVTSSHWRTLSPSTVPAGTTSVGVGRFGKELQLVWTRGGQLYTAILDPSGAVAIPAKDIANWASLDEYPAVWNSLGQRNVSFAGLYDDDSGNPYSQGYQYDLSSYDGRTWSLTDQALSSSNDAYGSDGSDTVGLENGQPLQVYTASSASRISWHAGESPIPGSPADDPTGADTGNFAQDTGLGYLPGKAAWMVWYSTASNPSRAGIQAQEIGVDNLMQAPGSYSTTGHGSAAASQRIRVANSGGKLWAAYGVGYPSVTHEALWQIGTHHVLTVRSGGDDEYQAAAAGTGGRVWLLWPDRDSGVIHAARTNPAGTRLGATCSVAAPVKGARSYDLTGDGAAGPLQIIDTAGRGTAARVYSTTVQPCLSVSVKPSTIRRSHATKVTVVVADAGAAVSGATVNVLGHKATTNRSGRATLHLRTSSRGRHPVTVGKRGYTTAQETLSVH